MIRTKIPLILIVDDSDLTRTSLTRLFEEYNCRTESCEDGIYGIQKQFRTSLMLLYLIFLCQTLMALKLYRLKSN